MENWIKIVRRMLHRRSGGFGIFFYFLYKNKLASIDTAITMKLTPQKQLLSVNSVSQLLREGKIGKYTAFIHANANTSTLMMSSHRDVYGCKRGLLPTY